MRKPIYLYRVYLQLLATGKVAKFGETMAVSEAEAENHLRFREYGELSIERLESEKGLRLVAARVGTTKAMKLAQLTGELPPAPKVRQHRQAPAQQFFAGTGFGLAEPPTRPHRVRRHD
ncbi:MAG: hypothetical protein WCW56_01210 [Candidatus Paceibacterota bacterium]